MWKTEVQKLEAQHHTDSERESHDTNSRLMWESVLFPEGPKGSWLSQLRGSSGSSLSQWAVIYQALLPNSTSWIPKWPGLTLSSPITGTHFSKPKYKPRVYQMNYFLLQVWSQCGKVSLDTKVWWFQGQVNGFMKNTGGEIQALGLPETPCSHNMFP